MTTQPRDTSARLSRRVHQVHTFVTIFVLSGTIAERTAFNGPTMATKPSGSSGETTIQACSAGRWAIPTRLASGVNLRVARYPRLAIGAQTGYVIGVDIQKFDSGVVPTNPLTVWTLDGREIGQPPGRFAFLYPRGAVDSQQRLHLLWAEPRVLDAGIDARAWLMLRPATLLTATYESTTGWSTAHELPFDIDQPRWQWKGIADNLGEFSSEQGVGLTPMRPPKTLTYMFLSEQRTWERSVIPFAGAYVSLASSKDRIVAAYAAADSDWMRSAENPTHEDANSVFVRASLDHGRTWSMPRLIQHGGRTPAHQVQVLLGKQGEIHLLWKQVAFTGQVIRHVHSDDGVRWSAPDDLPAPSLDNMRAVIDACGDVRLVAEDWSRGVNQLQLVEATWNAHWSATNRLFVDLEAMTPDVRNSSNGVSVLTFVGRPLGASSTTPYATFLSRLEN